MYSLQDYGEMIADFERVQAYNKAIGSAIRPGDTALELGCGPGIFALLASRAGARRVYAIDYAPIVGLARQLAAANGLGERIQFFEADSRKIELPERVNVIISDVRGALPLFAHAVSTVEDARVRFLVPNGTMIPQRDILKAAVVEAETTYKKLISPWTTSLPGVDLRDAIAPLLNNEFYHLHFAADQLLTEPQSWCVLNYQEGATSRAMADLHFVVRRNGTAHGICLWFEARLFGECGYSTGPGTSKGGISGQMFLPWPNEVHVISGQALEIGLKADLIGESYVWQWETHIPAWGTQPEQHFRQSSLNGAQLSPQSLRRRAADFVPALSESGQADRWLLGAIDGKTSLQEIAQSAAQRFPKIFPRWEDALTRAAELADQFSRR